jgi:hypothetical protein
MIMPVDDSRMIKLSGGDSVGLITDGIVGLTGRSSRRSASSVSPTMSQPDSASEAVPLAACQ